VTILSVRQAITRAFAMGNRTLLLCGGAFTLATATLYVLTPSPLQGLDNALYDALLRSTIPEVATGIPVIVDVDEKSLAEFGQWPWPRYRIALLLEKLKGLGIVAVGLDMVFSEADRTSLRIVQQDIQRDLRIDMDTRGLPRAVLDNDRRLAEALASGRVVLGYAFTFRSSDTPSGECLLHPVHLGVRKAGGAADGVPPLFSASGVLCNLRVLSEAAGASGFFNVVPDSDGVLRRAPLFVEYKGNVYPSLAIATLMQAHGADQIILTANPRQGHTVQIGQATIPLDSKGNLLIRYRGKTRTFPRVSAGDLLANRASRQQLQGKVAIVGASAAGIADFHTVPTGVMFPGVEIHATLLDNVLQKDFISRPTWASGVELLLVLICGSASAILLCVAGPVWSSLGLGPAAAGLWYGSQWILGTHGAVVSPLFPWIAWGGNFLALVLLQHWQTERALVRRTRHLEAVRTVSEEIIRELNLTTLLQLVLRRSVELVGATAGVIFLWDQAGQTLVPRVWTELWEWIREVRIRPGEGLVGLVAEQRTGQFVNDSREWTQANPLLLDRSAITALLAEPLLYRNGLVGVIALSHENVARRFGPTDRELIALLGAQAVVAIENARLFTEMNQSFRDLQEAQATLVRSEKLRGLGQMAAGIAHDLNNVLAAILAQVDLLRLRVSDDGTRRALTLLETAASDGASIVRRLQDFSRQRASTTLTPLDLGRIVNEAVDITRPRWKDEAQRRGRGIDMQVHVEGLPPVLGHAPDIREALTNLIFNAVDAMPHGGTLTLAGASTPEGVTLWVTDTGIGMTEEVRQHVFEPFFTTKGVRGTGLGLSVVYGIMERHGGRIEVASTPGRGTRFTLYFQAASAGNAPAPKIRSRTIPPHRILLIDDDPLVRQAVAAVLRAIGQVVFEADSGPAGLAVLGEQSIDVLLTDLGMPGMTGWEVARTVRTRFPYLPIILLTGWGDRALMESEDGALVNTVLPKPVRIDDIVQAISDVTETPPPQPS